MFQKKRNTFHGGVHPYEGKELSKDKPIVKAQPGNLLYYAVSQTSERLLCRSYKKATM